MRDGCRRWIQHTLPLSLVAHLQRSQLQEKRKNEKAYRFDCSCTSSCKCADCYPLIYAGKYAVNHHNYNEYHRNNSTTNNGRSLFLMVRFKRNSQHDHRRCSSNLDGCRRQSSTSIGGCKQSGRSSRTDRYYPHHYKYLYHYILVGLLSVSPVYAEEPRVQNTSNPVAAATGNVTNQAVQFQNNGAPSRQYFAGGNSCNGPTVTLSPFYMGNDTTPYDHTGYVKSDNWGVQLSLMVPLDVEMRDQCKRIAKRHEEKMRLDYELVRALKCTEIMNAGFTFRPGSRVEVLCHDVVPIVSILNE